LGRITEIPRQVIIANPIHPIFELVYTSCMRMSTGNLNKIFIVRFVYFVQRAENQAPTSNPPLMAFAEAAARVRTSSFSKIDFKWRLTVLGVTYKAPAISLFL